MERGWRQPGGDVFGPLDGEAVGRREKILEHQGVELIGAFEAVGIEMDQRPRAAMQGEDGEGRARVVVGQTSTPKMNPSRIQGLAQAGN